MTDKGYTIEMEGADEVILSLDDDVRFIWSRAAVEDLIELYKKHLDMFNDPHVRKRMVWRKVNQLMLQKGHTNLTDEMCYNKWRNLRKVYKECIVGVRSEQSRARWGFFEPLHELFENDPAFQKVDDQPKVYKRSSDGLEVIEFVPDDEDRSTSAKKPFREHQRFSHSQETQPSSQQCNNNSISAQLPSEPPIWFKEFLQTYRQDEARRMEALRLMHSDIMKLERKKCALLQELISKLGSDDEELSPREELSSKACSSSATVLKPVNSNISSRNARAENVPERAEHQGDKVTSVSEASTKLTPLVVSGCSPKLRKSEMMTTLSQPSACVTQTPVKLLVTSQSGLKAGQPVFISSQTNRGKVIVPVRKIVVSANEANRGN